jgi:transposase
MEALTPQQRRTEPLPAPLPKAARSSTSEGNDYGCPLSLRAAARQRDGGQERLRLLKLAEQLGNVARACAIVGYSRDSFYRFKAAYTAGGEAALQAISKHRPILKNRVAREIEAAVLELAAGCPRWGKARVAKELRRDGLAISPAGVRCVWLRHGLETARKRVRALGTEMVPAGAQDATVLTAVRVTAPAQVGEDNVARGGSRRMLELQRGGRSVLRWRPDRLGGTYPASLAARASSGTSIQNPR